MARSMKPFKQLNKFQRGKTMNDNKQHLQVISIQLETLAELPSVKKFLELQQKAAMLSQLIKKDEASDEQV